VSFIVGGRRSGEGNGMKVSSIVKRGHRCCGVATYYYYYYYYYYYHYYYYHYYYYYYLYCVCDLPAILSNPVVFACTTTTTTQ